MENHTVTRFKKYNEVRIDMLFIIFPARSDNIVFRKYRCTIRFELIHQVNLIKVAETCTNRRLLVSLQVTELSICVMLRTISLVILVTAIEIQFVLQILP